MKVKDRSTQAAAVPGLCTSTTDHTLTPTGSLLAALPILAVFMVLGRRLVVGIRQGAVKG